MFQSIDKIENPSLLPVLTLAIVGDSVYDLYFKSRLITLKTMPCGRIHTLAIGYVRASAQSYAIRTLEPELTEEETAVYHRGRNAKPSSMPKHADVSEYHRATGFEALIGYLYLKGEQGRIDYLLDHTYQIITEQMKENK
jgi:ribonuclease-3 family protein